MLFNQQIGGLLLFFTKWKENPGELPLVESGEKVRLILFRVSTAVQSEESIMFNNSRIMTGSNFIHAMIQNTFHEQTELDFPVAYNTRVWSKAFEVIRGKVVQHLLFKFMAKIYDVQLDANCFSNGLNLCSLLCKIRLGKLHEKSFNLIVILEKKGACSGVNTTTHCYANTFFLH